MLFEAEKGVPGVSPAEHNEEQSRTSFMNARFHNHNVREGNQKDQHPVNRRNTRVSRRSKATKTNPVTKKVILLPLAKPWNTEELVL